MYELASRKEREREREREKERLVPVDEGACLQVEEVQVSKLGDEVDDAVLLRHLHSHGEVLCGFGWEEDVDGASLEGGVLIGLGDLDHVQLK